MEPGIKRASERYLEYLRSVRNSSPHTILNYGKDLEQFLRYLSPPGAEPPALPEVTHHLIREYVAHLHDQGLQKSSIARKLAALRSFFKYCVRDGLLKENPARLVATPRLPKRIPSVLSAEEMNYFLNQLSAMDRQDAEPVGIITARGPERGREPSPPPRPRATRDALRRGASRQRVDWPQPGRHGSERASPARARQRRQGAHRALWHQGADCSRCLLAGAHRAPAAVAAGASRCAAGRGGRLPQLRRAPPEPAFRSPHRQEVRSPGEHQLGSPSALPAPRL